MTTTRPFVISCLSVACIATFLYYSIVPRGPHLFHWLETQVQDAPSSTNNTPEKSKKKGSEADFKPVERFDPEVLLSAPRRGPAIPNEGGTLAVYTVSTYSFETHVKTKEIRVLDLENGRSHLITNAENVTSPNWLDSERLLWLQVDANTTSFIVSNADGNDPYTIAHIPAPISDMKVSKLDDQRHAVAAIALADPDGSLHNPGAVKAPLSSAKLYDNVFVRHWDEYVKPQRNAIWHGIISSSGPSTKKSLGGLTNILQGTNLESPIPTFGGLDNFDLGSKGIAFVARDPSISAATNTKSNFYYVSIEDQDKGLIYQSPLKYVVAGFEGASTSPSLSHDGKSAVFLQMKENGYESDQNYVILVDLSSPQHTRELSLSAQNGKSWDRSPADIGFGPESKSILFTATDQGKRLLFKAKLSDQDGGAAVQPTALTSAACVSHFQTLNLNGSKTLISSSSFVDNSFYAVVDVSADEPNSQVVSSSSRDGSFFGLSSDQISEIWFDGEGDYKLHAWVIKPSTFDPQKTYPLAYIIHGGPQGSWEEGWSTRWNPAVFAEQGYVVVLPDPTGSTGYGQAFTDAIAKQWGGRPYEDLVRGFDYLKSNLTFIDTDRSVALGASYGGYMMAWMEGQPLAKSFKALVCHDGSFNLPAQLSSDEQYFPNHDLGGPPTQSPHAWEEWSPHAYISNWTTPMLVIHNELDYRLPISEGLAMFNVLQERNVSSRFLSFPDENHWVLKEENSLVWHTVVLNWINAHVGLPQYKNEKDLGLEVQN